MSRYLYLVILFLVLFKPGLVQSQTLTGMSGLFMTPTAEIKPDKSVMLGSSYIPKGYLPISWSKITQEYHNHQDYYLTIAFLPRIELQFRYAYLLSHSRGNGVEMFMDRSVSGRVLLLKESRFVPSVAFGVEDPGREAGFAVSRHYGANYFVGTKNFELGPTNLGVSFGYAFDLFGEKTRTLRNAFGGVGFSLDSVPQFTLIAEHDSFRYNVAGRVVLFNRVQVMAGLLDVKELSGNVSYRFEF